MTLFSVVNSEDSIFIVSQYLKALTSGLIFHNMVLVLHSSYNFKGHLKTDGYSAYHCMSKDIIISGCMAHSRRKFMDCLKGLDLKSQKGTVAGEAIKRIALLYKIEALLVDKTVQERYEERLKQSKPILDALFKWAEIASMGVPGNSLISKAFTYLSNQKEYLYAFLLDGRISIDNNATERAIRPFTIGRNNWLFCDTPKGAEASAIIYSIVETAKANKLKPYDYLVYILEEIHKHYLGNSLDFLDKLLPWSESIPISCKSLKK